MLAVSGSRVRHRRTASARTRVAAILALSIVAVVGAAIGPMAVAASVVDAIAPSATDATASVAVIVPITVPAGDRGVISTEALTEYTAVSPPGLLTRQLDAVDGTSATLAVDPMIAESIRALGSAAPATAKAWLERLESLPNERFALPYADADVTLFTQSTADAVLEPTGFAGIESVTATPTATATPTPTSSTNGAIDDATTESATSTATTVDDIVWARSGTVAADDLSKLAASTVILGDADVVDAAAVGGVADIDAQRVLVVDADASTAVAAAAHAADDATFTTAVATAVDAVGDAIAAQDADGAVVVLAMPRLEASNASRLAATITAVLAGTGATSTGLSPLVASTRDAPDADLIPGAQSSDRLDEVNRLLGAEHATAGFATAVATPALLLDDRRLRTLALGSVGWVGRDDWSTAIDTSLARVDTLLDSVRVIESSSLFLADRSRLPVAIQNDGTQAVTLLVSADARTGLLDVDGDSVEVVVPAGSQATAEFDATAVSNGSVLVTVTMTSPSGVPIGTPASAEVNVQAGWETPVVAAFGAAVVVLLCFGVVRTVRRHRARQRGGEDAVAGREEQSHDGQSDDGAAGDGRGSDG